MEFYYVKKFERDLDDLWEELKERVEGEGFLIVGERVPVSIVEREDGIIADYHVLFICDRDVIAELVKINPNIGALIPCTAFGYVREDGVYLGIGLPSVAWKVAGDEIVELMRPMEERLKEIINSL
ncbi:hypothetical protein PAP_08880 [Palaeococcus pacificus DY20341]|uniref:DUF302 domain-containing protein n=1 Tax=Palaeococcus pacificus DY20341 TaxID=1343739 RepID=A0A075LVJ9_9EURY|nr:DUF302 domain-containing protein [Palaeococcus pacificus]AIF70156.1 hypothetical protein PAP_08880 [Palaeococcus pacificus DY20341]